MSPRPYGAADTAFGLDVLNAWCRTDPRANLVLSPSSLASGLGMAYLGARGGTAQAMAGVLQLPAEGGQQLKPATGTVGRAAGSKRPNVTLDASDQIWADPGLVTERSYLNAVATGYDAGVAQAPLLHSPERARQEINQAIATANKGQIPQLLLPGSLNNIGWVLTDALYMHAAWATPFDANATSPGPFTTAAGQRVTAQFMTGGQFRAVRAAAGPPSGSRTAAANWPWKRCCRRGRRGCTMPAVAALGTMTSAWRPASPAHRPEASHFRR